MIVEIKKTESGCTYKFDDSAYLGKSEKEHGNTFTLDHWKTKKKLKKSLMEWIFL